MSAPAGHPGEAVAAAIAQGGLKSPDLLVQKIDLVRRAALVVRMSREGYRAASFLDDRIFTPQTEGTWISLAQLESALASVRPALPLHFIFHAGHVGSTLLSRLLEEACGVLALREPLVLRTLAEAHDVIDLPESLLSPAEFASQLALQLKLWQRGYSDSKCVVLKATSSAGRLGPALLAAQEGARAVYLNLKAEPYLAALLAGENSPIDLRGHGPERVRRLARLLGTEAPRLHLLALGEMAALAWLTERLTEKRLGDEFGARVLSLDFDVFLKDVPAAMASAAHHLALPASSEVLAKLGTSPVLRSYSKAPEHAYSPSLRQEILAESRQHHAQEIGRGLRWLERMAAMNAGVAAVLV